MRIAMLNEVGDEVKLVRFVDESGMLKSVGDKHATQLKCSFPLQLLSHYKSCEGIAGDPDEGGTIVDLGVKGSGRSTPCNKVLISCWSVCDDLRDPWESLSGSSFADRIARPYVLVSSVGQVKSQIQKILDEINSTTFDGYEGALILNAICGLVQYYPVKGVPLDEWNNKTDVRLGVDISMIQSIYHKPVKNRAGQRYDTERECRFALIANVRNFKATGGELISGNKIIEKFIYPSLYIEPQSHYIEKVFECLKGGGYREISISEITNKAEIA